MLLRYCLVYITVITLRHILYLIYLGPCLGLCDLFFIVSLIFIAINRITLLKQTPLFFVHSLEHHLSVLDDNVDEESE